MPTIDISFKDLKNLMGAEISFEELEDQAILYVKGEIDGFEDDEVKVDCKETNRPDLWSTEGMARQIAPFYTKKKGVPKYNVKKGNYQVHVDKSTSKVRPAFVAAVIKNVKVTDYLIKQAVQLQEKVCMTFGRKRKEAAIGLYDLDKLKFPLYYKTVEPESIKFVPLGFKIKMTPGEILEDHPKGQEYGTLIKGYKRYPLVIDSNNEVASLPPIINSDYTGKVTEDTKNLFVEVTGYDLETVKVALNVMVAALADRGGLIESVEIIYPDKKVITPDFTPKKKTVSLPRLQKLSGLNLSNKEIKELLEKSGYNVNIKKDTIEVEYPSYRQDILHDVDVIEDLLIAYGYNKIEPVIPDISTVGNLDKFEVFCDKVRNFMVGLGCQELLTFTLSNKDTLFEKMNVNEFPCVEIANPVSSQWSVLRNWVLPSMMEFLGKNSSQEYPQHVYEVGDAVVLDENEETKTKSIKRLAWAYAGKDATFTYAKQVLDFLLNGLKKSYDIVEVEHSSFINGRVGRVVVDGKKVAYIGEVNPQVIENFGIKLPVVAFELNLTDLYELLDEFK
ncbi:phenylalanine--tRNA ligase subunit beta [Candidatus Woesearchaeota archaeon]|nr:MAG: phenylalanine--tRNA ligase subunit beta [Candidatus Woesearchaeota archaeon]